MNKPMQQGKRLVNETINFLPLSYFYLKLFGKELTLIIISGIAIVLNIILSILNIVIAQHFSNSFEVIEVFNYFIMLIALLIVVVTCTIICFKRDNHLWEEEKRFGYSKTKSFMEKNLAIVIFVYGLIVLILIIDAIIAACFINYPKDIRFGFNINFDVFLLLFALIVMVFSVSFTVYCSQAVSLILMLIFSLITIFSPILSSGIEALENNGLNKYQSFSREEMENDYSEFNYYLQLNSSLYNYATQNGYQDLEQEYNQLLINFSTENDNLRIGNLLIQLQQGHCKGLPMISDFYNSVDETFKKFNLTGKYNDPGQVLRTDSNLQGYSMFEMLSYFAKSYHNAKWSGYLAKLISLYHYADRYLENSFVIDNWFTDNLNKIYQSPLELLIFDVFIDSINRIMHIDASSPVFSQVAKLYYKKDNWYHDILVNAYVNPFYQIKYLASSFSHNDYFADNVKSQNLLIFSLQPNYYIRFSMKKDEMTSFFEKTIDGQSDFASRIVIKGQNRIINYSLLYAVYYICFAGCLFICLPIYRRR